MADTNRLAQLADRTAEKGSKFVLVGDQAQLSPIAAGGLFSHLKDCTPTAELKEVHRAENQWEREAWAQLRDGEATKALAAYQAEDRLHIADTREQAAQRMVGDWNEQRLENPQRRTVMLTDASNEELDKLNKHAQEYRDREGELGNDRADLPDAPYQLATGDQIIFTKPHYQPGKDRVENGTLGTIKDIQDESKLKIDTHGANEREVAVDTKEFADIKLGYAQHVYKAQGLTANNALTLIGGWHTDKERAYVALTRAREQTNIYVSKQDLGTQGMNPEAIERLAEKIEQSKAQEASIAREAISPDRSTTNDQAHTNESAPETAPATDPGLTRDDGVGGAAPQDAPDPSPNENDRETLQASQEQRSEREPNQPTDEQPERDSDQAHDLGLEID